MAVNEQGSWKIAGMAAFFVLFVLGGVMYIDLNDRLNADQAYRTVELRNQRDRLKSQCDENFKNLIALQELIRQHPDFKAPVEMMVSSQCAILTPTEKPKE